MSEMVERVARAVVEAHDVWVSGLKHPMIENPLYRQRLARAAVEAMREPTDGMCEAGQKVNNIDDTPGHFEYLSRDEMAAAWQAMIDEALK